MSKTADTTIPLEAGFCYHIFNRGNNKQTTFYEEKNYGYFLEKYGTAMNGYLDTFAYCLLPNHFHLLVRVKDLRSVLESAKVDYPLISENTWFQWDIEIPNFEFPRKGKVALKTILQMKLPPEMPIKIANWAVSEKMRRWLMGYAKAINKQEDLTGSLFQKKFRRKQVTDMDYLTYLVWYVHNNPVHHNVFHSLQDYAHSSYKSFLSEQPTKLKRQEVLQWYGGVTAFIEYHKNMTLGYDGNDVKFWME